MKAKIALAFLSVILAGCVASGQRPSTVGGLRVEYLTNPLGIDVARPRLSWVYAPDAPARGQVGYRILVASSLHKLNSNQGDLWDSGRVASRVQTFVPYGGRPIGSRTTVWWKVLLLPDAGPETAWSEPGFWSTGILQEAEWTAKFIGLPRPAGVSERTPLPFPWLRKTVVLDTKPERAMAYVNALGYYELYINGKKVGDDVLSPAVTDYSHRNLYVAHDISTYLNAGTNTLALWLGRGWYVRGHPGVVYDGPLARAEFDIESAGKPVRVETDGSWKAKASPITPLGKGTAFGDYGGERYDASLEVEDWAGAALDDSAWQSAAVVAVPKVTTSANMVEPNRILETLSPAKIEQTTGGWLIDMGKNFTGWLELKLPANVAAGKNLTIEYADWPGQPGRYATFNQRDEYRTRAGAGQVVRSRFNYHGFRYAHISGLDAAPTAQDVKGYFIRTAYDRAGQFESSDELMNRIYRMVTWTYECLTLGGYVVDCPTRERLGYGGDAGTSIETGLFNFDTGGLYSRWATNWRDAQAASGDLPYTAPNYPDQGGGGPMWSGFSVTLPWQVYLQYGDTGVLEKNYEMIRKWLEFAQTKTSDDLLEPYASVGMRTMQWNYLGDWVTPRRAGAGDLARDPVAAKFINNAHYLYTLDIAAKIATIIKQTQDATLFNTRAAAVRKALRERFYDVSTGRYATGQQPYLALALLLHIVPDDRRADLAKTLESTILETNRGHIDGGMHGTYFVLKQLMEGDRNDLIYTMASKEDHPSWGNMLKQGATTSWEDWTGGSHIHDTLISIGAWFIEGIGGIRIDEANPGFRHFVLKPTRVGELTFAKTSYRSIHGPIASNWRVENGTTHFDGSVPTGTAATLLLPCSPSHVVVESGTRPAPLPPTSPIENGRTKIELRPGPYRYSCSAW